MTVIDGSGDDQDFADLVELCQGELVDRPRVEVLMGWPRGAEDQIGRSPPRHPGNASERTTNGRTAPVPLLIKNDDEGRPFRKHSAPRKPSTASVLSVIWPSDPGEPALRRALDP